jgi:hypothetical protein
MAIAEQALLPAVRNAGNSTLIIADGFSCREQIRHGAGRHALHPVEVLQLALRNARITSVREIEDRMQQSPAAIEPASAMATFAAVAAAGGLAFLLRRRSAGQLHAR